MRQQIREKTRELADLLQSPNQDKAKIAGKIRELNRLESDLDREMFLSGDPRRGPTSP